MFDETMITNIVKSVVQNEMDKSGVTSKKENLTDGIITRVVEDIVRYEPNLKQAKILHRGEFFDATLSSFGIEGIPRPDMYSALWISTQDIKPSLLDEPLGGSNFMRQLSVLVPFPKELSVGAEGQGYPLSQFTSGGKISQSVGDGSTFSGLYNNAGDAYGMLTDKEGNLMIKGSGGTITIGEDGIDIKGDNITTDGKVKDNILLQDDPLPILPHAIVFPRGSKMVDMDMIDKIKAEVNGFLEKFAGKFGNIIEIGVK